MKRYVNTPLPKYRILGYERYLPDIFLIVYPILNSVYGGIPNLTNIFLMISCSIKNETTCTDIFRIMFYPNRRIELIHFIRDQISVWKQNIIGLWN